MVYLYVLLNDLIFFVYYFSTIKIDDNFINEDT